MITVRKSRILGTITLILISVILCPISHGKIIYVDDDAPNDQGPGDPSVSDPNEDGSADHPFDSIQAGINTAEYGDTISVAPGTYYENIILKNGINLSGAGADVTIIDANGYGDVVDARANDVTVCGFMLRNSGEDDSGHMNCGVYADGSYAPIVRNNVIVHNKIGIGVWDGANPDIVNNVIKNNFIGLYLYGSEQSPSNPRIVNNTIVNNEENGITLRVMVSPVIVNNIITGHVTGINHNYVTGSPGLNYNNLWHNDVNYMRDNSADDTLAGPGSISIDPYFAEPGYWADVNDPNIIIVLGTPYGEPNDPNAAWVAGDYHLKSQTGRWDPSSESWVQDDLTSPCIDAGDSNSDFSGETWPHGGRINMGVYGGTRQASMSSETEGMSLPRVAYIYSHKSEVAESFESLLETYGCPTTLIRPADITETSLDSYDLIIVADDTQYQNAWADPNNVVTIEDSGKPVVGLGDGGYDFFGLLGLSIGYPYGGHGSRNSIEVIDLNCSLFRTPYSIEIPEDRVLQLYTETNHVSIYLWPTIPETVTALAGEAYSHGYYPLVMEHDRYLLWGFSESPQKMTEVGKTLFINVVIWTTNKAWESDI